MIEYGENVEINSSEEIESQGTCIYVEHMHVLLKLYIYLLVQLFIEYVNLLYTINSNMYK